MDPKQSEELQSAIRQLTDGLLRLNTILEGQTQSPTVSSTEPAHPADEIAQVKPESSDDRHNISQLMRELQEKRQEWLRTSSTASTNENAIHVICIEEKRICSNACLPDDIPWDGDWQQVVSSEIRHIFQHMGLSPTLSKYSPDSQNGAPVARHGLWKKEALNPLVSVLSFEEFTSLSKWLQSPKQAVRLVLAYVAPPSEVFFQVKRDTSYPAYPNKSMVMPCCLTQEGERFLMEFSLRYWDVVTRHPKTEADADAPETGGLLIKRLITHTRHSDSGMFVEARSIVAVSSSGSYAIPEYVTVTLSDGFSRTQRNETMTAEEFCRRYGLRCGTQSDAITYFLARIISMFETSQEAWFTVIDTLDDTSFVKAHRIFKFWCSPHTWHEDSESMEIMLQSLSKQSKDCFALLQFLKVAMDHVSESKNSFNRLRRMLRDLSPTNTHMANGVLYNLNEASKLVDDVTEKTLKRLQQQVDATTRLQNGIFSEISLRETRKAMYLNRTIYVFTVVTVLYAPLGFLATFWALPFLNDPEEGNKVQESPAFLASMILVPLLTYGACLPITTSMLTRRWGRFRELASVLLKISIILLVILSSLTSRTLSRIPGGLFSRPFDSAAHYSYDYGENPQERLASLMSDDFVEPNQDKRETKLLWRLFRPIRWVRAMMKPAAAERQLGV